MLATAGRLYVTLQSVFILAFCLGMPSQGTFLRTCRVGHRLIASTDKPLYDRLVTSFEVLQGAVPGFTLFWLGDRFSDLLSCCATSTKCTLKLKWCGKLCSTVMSGHRKWEQWCYASSTTMLNQCRLVRCSWTKMLVSFLHTHHAFLWNHRCLMLHVNDSSCCILGLTLRVNSCSFCILDASVHVLFCVSPHSTVYFFSWYVIGHFYVVFSMC